jgi:hypothetical protein
MRIICVEGAANTGKSTAIRAFMLTRGWERLPIGRRQREVKIVIEIRKSQQNLRVGVVSKGDTPQHIQEAFDFCQTCTCKVMICAARTGSSAIRLQGLATHHGMLPITVIRTQQFQQAQQRVQQTKQIVKLINGAI